MSARFKFSTISTKGKLFEEAQRIINSGLIEDAKSLTHKQHCAERLIAITTEVAAADISDPEIRAYYGILLIAEKKAVNEAAKNLYAGLMKLLKEACSAALENSHLLVADKSSKSPSL